MTTEPDDYPGTSSIRARLAFIAKRWIGYEPSYDVELILYRVFEMAHAEGYQCGRSITLEPVHRTGESTAPRTSDEYLLQKLRWLRDTVGVDIERMFARAQTEKDGRESTNTARDWEAEARWANECRKVTQERKDRFQKALELILQLAEPGGAIHTTAEVALGMTGTIDPSREVK